MSIENRFDVTQVSLGGISLPALPPAAPKGALEKAFSCECYKQVAPPALESAPLARGRRFAIANELRGSTKWNDTL